MLCDQLSKTLLVWTSIALECLTNLVARIREHANAAVTREFNNRGIQVAYTSRPLRSLCERVLDDESIGRISIENAPDASEACAVLLGAARFAGS